MAVACFAETAMSIRNQQWPWYAIQARTGREKNAALLLENAGYQCYLPLIKPTRQWSDGVKQTEVSLFPEYLFCRMNPDNRLPVLTTAGVVRIAGVGETLLPVEEQEIAAIQQVAKSGVSMIPWPYLQTGHVVCLENGPLSGLSGIILRIKSGLRLVLSISLLRRSIAVDVDREWIGEAYPLEPARRSGSVQPIRSSSSFNPGGNMVWSSRSTT
jgi:transcription antitermination factor NusG